MGCPSQYNPEPGTPILNASNKLDFRVPGGSPGSGEPKKLE
jgi:hypothetical protein